MSPENENQLLFQFHSLLNEKKLEAVKPLVEMAQERFPLSCAMQFCVGRYYEEMKMIETAKQQYLLCITLHSKFVQPYIGYARTVLETKNASELAKLKRLLRSIYGQPTLNNTVNPPRVEMNVRDTRLICKLLGGLYMEERNLKEAKAVFMTLYDFLERIRDETDPEYIAGFKEACHNLSQLYAYSDMEKSHEYCIQGIRVIPVKNNSPEEIHDLHQKLLVSLVISSNYVIESAKIPEYAILFENYRANSPKTIPQKYAHDKLRIGYLSCDFNRNALVYFVIPLLKYFDPNRFEVYCYYTNPARDYMTDYLETLPVQWVYTSKMNLLEVYNHMKENEIDILIDLNTIGYGGLLELVAMKPAPIIINYLGYPEHVYFPEVDYRICDRITNTDLVEKNVTSYGKREKTLFMPNLFICYQPNPSCARPLIVYSTPHDKIHLGVINKVCKQSALMRGVWKRILEANPDTVLITKLNEVEQSTEVYDDFPKDQVQVQLFQTELDGYYQLFNNIDIAMDTLPYSGTTTTCSALMMGLPTITIGKSNKHCCNVSESILTHCGFQEFIASSLEHYEKMILSQIQKIREEKAKSYAIYLEKENEHRKRNREIFLERMDPVRFMSDYENLLKTMYQNHYGNNLNNN